MNVDLGAMDKVWITVVDGRLTINSRHRDGRSAYALADRVEIENGVLSWVLGVTVADLEMMALRVGPAHRPDEVRCILADAKVPELLAERDQFKRLWDETRETAERLRMALEEIALPCAAEAVGRPVPYVVARAREALGGNQGA